jgi:hypothetical protein
LVANGALFPLHGPIITTQVDVHAHRVTLARAALQRSASPLFVLVFVIVLVPLFAFYVSDQTKMSF